MGTLSIWHWVIVLIIVMLVFGTKKLRNVGEDLGGAVKGFREGMKSADPESALDDNPPRKLEESAHQAEKSAHHAANTSR